MRHQRTAILLTVAASVLAACAQSPAGLERASAPAHATGEGVPGASRGSEAPPAAAVNPGRTPASTAHQHTH